METLALFQEFNDEELGLVIAIYGGGCCIGLIIQAAICWFVSGIYRAIPEEHRAMPPGRVWLNMIPFVPLVFNFFVFPGLADSFKSAFRENPPGQDVGDCGRNLAMGYAICSLLAVVPFLGCIAAPAALVLLILVLVKANTLKGLLGAEAADPGWG